MENFKNLNELLNIAVNSVVAGLETREHVVKVICDYVDKEFCDKKVTSELVSSLIVKLNKYQKDALEAEELKKLDETFSINIHFEDSEQIAHSEGGNENGKKESSKRTCA